MSNARIWCRILFAVLLVGITALALSPKPPAAASLGWDKANHLMAFFVLAVALRGGWPAARGSVLWLALLAYGVGLEWAQGLTPNRQAEVADVGADLLGIGFAQLVMFCMKQSRACPASR